MLHPGAQWHGTEGRKDHSGTGKTGLAGLKILFMCLVYAG